MDVKDDEMKERSESTSDEACQTYDSLNRRDKQEVTAENSDQPQNPINLAAGDANEPTSPCLLEKRDVDTTLPKVVVARDCAREACTTEGNQGFSSDGNSREPSVPGDDVSATESLKCNCSSGNGEAFAERQPSWLQDHQCAHPSDMVGMDHEAKQPHTRPEPRHPIQSTDDSTEYDFLRSSSFETDDKNSVFGASSSFSSIHPLCKVCTDADRLLCCGKSRDFWHQMRRRMLDESCCTRVWSTVEEKLKELFPDEPALKRKPVINLLKCLLGVRRSMDEVGIQAFVDVVNTFGPIRHENNRCVILKQLEDMVTKSTSKDPKNKSAKISWFAGPMTGEDAEAKLKDRAPGTFLIRMSESERTDGCFVLNLVMKDESIRHYRIEGNPQKGIRSNPYNQCLVFKGKTFPDLPELVNDYLRQNDVEDEDDKDNSIMCIYICPGLPYNRVVNGYR